MNVLIVVCLLVFVLVVLWLGLVSGWIFTISKVFGGSWPWGSSSLGYLPAKSKSSVEWGMVVITIHLRWEIWWRQPQMAVWDGDEMELIRISSTVRQPICLFNFLFIYFWNNIFPVDWMDSMFCSLEMMSKTFPGCSNRLFPGLFHSWRPLENDRLFAICTSHVFMADDFSWIFTALLISLLVSYVFWWFSYSVADALAAFDLTRF